MPGVFINFSGWREGRPFKGASISYQKKWQKHDNERVILGCSITISFRKKNIRNGMKISNIMTEK